MEQDTRRRWRFTYLPSAIKGTVREYVFEGTKAERNAHFLETHVCNLCKEEMKGGPQIMFRLEDSMLVRCEETIMQEAYDDPMNTPCACEWDWDEEEEHV